MKLPFRTNRGRGVLLTLSALLVAADCTAVCGAEPPTADPFAGAVFRTRDADTGRISSWDRSGGNRDFISFKPGEIMFGEVDLAAGECELKFQYLGKGEASTGFYLAVDALTLKPVE